MCLKKELIHSPIKMLNILYPLQMLNILYPLQIQMKTLPLASFLSCSPVLPCSPVSSITPGQWSRTPALVGDQQQELEDLGAKGTGTSGYRSDIT